MSAGAFLNAFYTTNAGLVVSISIQPETAACVIEGNTNVIPAGPAGPGLPSAQVSKGKRSIGINARSIRVRFAPGAAPTGYVDGGIVQLPWLDPTSFALLPAKGTGTYLGSSVTLVGKTDENVR